MNTTRAMSSPISIHEILADVVTTISATAKQGETSSTAKIDSVTTSLEASPSGDTVLREYALYIAIDWADREHEVCYLDPTTQQRVHHELEHEPNVLHAWLQNLHQRYPEQQLAVALEQKTGSLFNFLVEDKQLDLYPVNPAMVARYRGDFHPSGAKDDPSDAELILDLLTQHRNKLMRLMQDDPLTRQLQLLTRKRRDVVNLRTQLNNRLKALLKQYYPLFLRVCGEDLFAPMACDLLLTYPCFDALKQADQEELRHVYSSHGSWKPQAITRRLKLIRMARPLTTDHTLIQAAILEATLLATLLRNVDKSIKAYDKAIAERFPQHEDASIFASFPGAGAVFAPRLLAAFGANRHRFHTATEVHNTMGVSPVKKESGPSTSIHWRNACPKFLRQSFQEYANESIRHSIWARAYYQMQVDRGKKHHAAIRALAFKWIRIMFRCWQARQPYDELRYLKSLQRRHSPLLEYVSKSDQVF